MLTEDLDQQDSGLRWEPVIAQRAYRSFQRPAAIYREHEQQRDILADLEWQMIAHEAEFSASIAVLKSRFIFVNPGAVQEFLSANRSLVSLLIDALPDMTDSFGAQTPLALDLLSEGTDSHTIYAIALSQTSAAESRASLQRFDDQWLIPNLSKVKGRIVFTYEFI